MVYEMKPWMYQGYEFTTPSEEYYGFVYLITNTTTGKQYIGKKLFWHKKSRIVKGKRKGYLAESDWKSYHGSSKELQHDVDTLSHGVFTREILHFCRNKSECSYYEAKEQFARDVLLKPDLYYNDWVSVKVTRKHLESKSRPALQRSIKPTQ